MKVVYQGLLCVMQVDKSIDMPSLVDVLWDALQEMSQQSFLSGPNLARAAPIFQSLVILVQSRHPCRMILLSQPQFWTSVHNVWTAAVDKMEVSGVDGLVALATHIIDLVTSAAFDVWNTHSKDMWRSRGSVDPDTEGQSLSLPEIGGSISLGSGPAMHSDLKKLVSDMFCVDGFLSSWLLQQALSKNLLEASDKADMMLTEAAEAAAVLVRSPSDPLLCCFRSMCIRRSVERKKRCAEPFCEVTALMTSTWECLYCLQLWCVMDKQVPADLSQDVLELWQELHACFSTLPHFVASSASTDSQAVAHTKRTQQALMQALLGQDPPADISRGTLPNYCTKCCAHCNLVFPHVTKQAALQMN